MATLRVHALWQSRPIPLETTHGHPLLDFPHSLEGYSQWQLQTVARQEGKCSAPRTNRNIYCRFALDYIIFFFYIFLFCVLIGVVWKGVGKNTLLSNDDPLTPNINKVMGFEFLEGGLKMQKMAKIGLLDLGSHF